MFTPDEAIARLDAALLRAGQTVVLRKTNSANPSVTVKANVRGVKADEIAGTTLTQTDKKVIISPTGLDDFGMPRAGGFVVVDDAPRAIIGNPEIMKMADVIVRIEIAVKGAG